MYKFKRRRGIVYTWLIALLVIEAGDGILWTMLHSALSTTQTLEQNAYPYGVYDPSNVFLINLGNVLIPFLVIISVSIMVIIAYQRRKSSEGP